MALTFGWGNCGFSQLTANCAPFPVTEERIAPRRKEFPDAYALTHIRRRRNEDASMASILGWRQQGAKTTGLFKENHFFLGFQFSLSAQDVAIHGIYFFLGEKIPGDSSFNLTVFWRNTTRVGHGGQTRTAKIYFCPPFCACTV